MNVKFLVHTISFLICLGLGVPGLWLSWVDGKIGIGRTSWNSPIDKAAFPVAFWFLWLLMALALLGVFVWYIGVVRLLLKGELKDYWD